MDRAFPAPGAASDEAAALLEHHPELVFFSKLRTHEPWPRPVYGLNELARITTSHGLSDVYVRDGDDFATEVASALKGSRVKVHRAPASGHPEPVHAGFFAFRPRVPKPQFRFVCAVTDPVVQTAIHALEALDSRFSSTSRAPSRTWRAHRLGASSSTAHSIGRACVSCTTRAMRTWPRARIEPRAKRWRQAWR